MCGITGLWHTNEQVVDPVLLRKVTDRIAHRGPDDEGFLWVDTKSGTWKENDPGTLKPDLALGFRRLSILDLSTTGHQPMRYDSGNYWIVFNGEIYNYLELRDELKQLGYNFRSGSDTEVILAAYAAWGEACLERFNGMWAFALLDMRQRTLFCARDRFGIKPFYFSWEKGSFAFASEIKAVLPLMTAVPAPNNALIYDFLVYGWADHTADTFFQGIQQLPAAHYLKIKDGKIAIKQYWKLDPDNRIELPSNEAYSERFLFLFEDAVRSHLRSDVAVGTCLSGGLDSSSIVCIANRLLLDEHTLPASLVGDRQKTFSSCFDDPRFDERQFIEQVLAVTGAESNYIFPNGASLVDVLPRIIWHQDEPFGSTSIFAQWSVMERVAERRVRVLLDGQGADELLGGYHTYFHFLWGNLIKQGEWRNLFQEINLYRQYYPLPLWRILLQTGQSFVPSSLVRWARKLKREGANTGLLGINPDFAHQYSQRSYNSSGWRDNMLESFLYDNLMHYSLPALLRYEDRNSMAHSVEARVPFLDYRLVEFITSLPISQKIQDATTKVILRNAMHDVLPEKIRQRRDKMGFVTPEKVWLKSELGMLLREVAYSPAFAQRGYLNAKRIQDLIESHQTDQRDISFIASRWLTLELWFQRFIDRSILN